MTKDEMIARAGSATALAKILGITQQAVSKWGQSPPALQVYRLKEKKPRWFRRPVGQPSE